MSVAELSVFVTRLEACLHAATLRAAETPSDADPELPTPDDPAVEALLIRSNVAAAQQMHTQLGDRAGHGALLLRIEALTDAATMLVARVVPEDDIDDNLHDALSDADSEHNVPEGEEKKEVKVAHPAEQSPRSNRRALGLCEPQQKMQTEAQDAEAKELRRKQKEEGLKQLAKVASEFKEKARELGDAVHEGDRVLEDNKAAVVTAQTSMSSQLNQVEKVAGWGWSVPGGSWLGGKVAMVMSLLTSSVLLLLLAAALCVVWLAVVQVVIMFPSVVYLKADGSLANPGLIRRLASFVWTLLQTVATSVMTLLADATTSLYETKRV